MKGYVNGEGYMGYVNGSYMLFASEEDYWEYMEDGAESDIIIAIEKGKGRIFYGSDGSQTFGFFI